MNRNLFKSIILGFFIGIAIVVPGISGSTISILFNLYDKILNSISNLFKKFKESIFFLLPILIGTIIGFIFGLILIKQIINILVVWFLTGLWHGANWNFIIWGVYFGIILIIEKLFLLKVLEKTPKIISRIYVLFVVLISFIIFSNENISILLENIKGLFNVSNGIISNVSLYYFESYFVTFVVAAIASIGIMNKLVEKCNKKIINIVEPVYLIVLLIVSISYIVDGSFNPFLYFRF